MWPISGEAQEALTTYRHGKVVMSVWRRGQRVRPPLDPDGRRPDFAPTGSLSYTGGTGVRAAGTIALPPFLGGWDTFPPGGVQCRLTWMLRHLDWSIEPIPLGTFDVVSRKEVDGVLQLGLRDLYQRVLDFDLEGQVTPRGEPVRAAAALIRPAIGAGVLAGESLATTGEKIGGQVYEGDRAEAVRAILDAAGMEAFISRDARLVIRRRPLLVGVGVGDVRPGAGGIFVGGEREQNRDRVLNRLYVRPDGQRVWFKPFVVENRNPRSPSNVLDTPVRSATVSNPLWRTRALAELGARSLLDRRSAMQATTTVTCASNPAWDPGDVVSVGLPGADGDLVATERHLIESFDLAFDGSDTTLQTSSARPTDDGDEVLA